VIDFTGQGIRPSTFVTDDSESYTLETFNAYLQLPIVPAKQKISVCGHASVRILQTDRNINYRAHKLEATPKLSVMVIDYLSI